MTNYIKPTSQFHQFNQIEQNPQFGSITNPRIFNFSQSPKLIKSTNIYHEYNNIEAKPNDQFQKKRIDSTKIPIEKSSETSLKMHEFMHENKKINAKGRVKGSYRPWETKPFKNFGRKRQKIFSGALPNWRERGKLEKVTWKKSNLSF